jgi:chondroitin sulfate proteoglycan 4
VSLTSRPAYPISAFTQAQLVAGSVLFTHSGCLAGGFSLQLSDGLNSVARRQFVVTVQQLALTERTRAELPVFPGMETPVTARQLEVVTTDGSSARQVVFLVTQAPTKGRLLFLADQEGARHQEVQNFTQADVNASRILYRHEAPFVQLKDYDSFSFEAMADYAPYRLKSKLDIVISVTAMIPGGIDRYIAISPVTCQEGGNVTIYPQNLNTTGIVEFIQRGGGVQLAPGQPHIRLQFVASPLRGHLSLGVRQVRAGDPFTQMDVDRGLLRYSHDHSDSTADRIGLAVYLAVEGPQGVAAKDLLVWEGQLNVTITPVNDRMPHLVTKNPSMVVVRGQTKTLNRDMLEVRDPDTAPEDILYTLMDNSLQGKIVFRERLTHSVSHFTQADINKERVMYKHDGSSAQTQVYFSVTDGRFQPQETGLSRHFRIHVIPLTLVLQNYSAITVQQGTTTAFITSGNMGAASNGRKDDIQYTVTIPPRGGQLLVEDRPAEVFWQINIDRDEVVYMQTDMSLSNDSFTADITNQDNKIPGLVFNITVLPLVKQEQMFVANIDNSTPLNLNHLDATKLAGLTASNPVYYLVSKPRLGTIKRIIRTSRTREPRSLRDRVVHHVTHEDIKNRVIYFVGSQTSLQRNVTDMLRYRLEAPGVQPATGTFTFTVTQSGVTPWQPLPNVTPTGHVPLPTLASRKDVVIAISVIASVLLIIVTAILFVKCRMGKEEERSKRQHIHNCQLSSEGRQRKHSQFDDIYDACGSGVLSLSSHPASPRPGGDRYEPRNGTLPRTGLGLRPGLGSAGQPVSDSDSWLESSRSRETSPSSSIPPSLPAFRVIPLCESESSGTHPGSHLSEPPLLPPFPRSSRCPALPCPALPCPALPCPALALPCPAPAGRLVTSVSYQPSPIHPSHSTHGSRPSCRGI